MQRTMQRTTRPSWIPTLAATAESLAQRLADAIAADVEAGRLAPGAQLPTQRALARQLGVTPGTVNRGYALAERAGWITAEVGRGSFVSPSRDPAVHDAGVARGASGAIELGLNYPAGDDAEAALAAALPRLARRSAGLLALTPYAGSPAHRAAGARWLRTLGLAADEADVLICAGVQHGLAAALTALAGPGDVLLTESLTGPGVKAVATMMHLRLVGVAGDRNGLLPDALAGACKATGARVLYTMPTLHTPTTITMPDARRRAIAEVLRAHEVIAIEDDAWGFLAGGRVTPLRNFAPDRVVYLTTFAKCLAPGLRVGYAVPPPALQRAITSSLGALTWVAPLLGELVAQWIDDGTAAAIAHQRERTARARQTLAERLLGRALARTAMATFHHWVTLAEPWRVDELVAQAAVQGVALAATDIFVPGRAPAPHAIRVCTGTEPDVHRVEQGLRIVARMLQSGPRGYSRSVA
jgi:DNA-binding transcriptional MocR family regulator